MPSKSKNKNSKKKPLEETEEEALQNSEDEYASQSGGETDSGAETENELGEDSATLDVDPDHEEDPNEDDKYDPVNENEELEDPDEETEIEDEVDEAAEEDEEAGEEGEEEVNDGEETAAQTKACHLKKLKDKDFIVLDEDDSNMYGKMEYKRIADEDRETDKIMTYYEMVRIIGTRTQQFNFGAEPLVRGLEGMHPAKMAYVELIAKMTPYIIKRNLPGKKYEEFRVDELEIIHEISDDFFVPENFDWVALMKQAEELSKTSSIVSQSRLDSSGVKKSSNGRSKSRKA